MGVFEMCPICNSEEETWQCLNLSVFCSPECKALYRSSGNMVSKARDKLAKERVLSSAQKQFNQSGNENVKNKYRKVSSIKGTG